VISSYLLRFLWPSVLSNWAVFVSLAWEEELIHLLGIRLHLSQSISLSWEKRRSQKQLALKQNENVWVWVELGKSLTTAEETVPKRPRTQAQVGLELRTLQAHYSKRVESQVSSLNWRALGGCQNELKNVKAVTQWDEDLKTCHFQRSGERKYFIQDSQKLA